MRAIMVLPLVRKNLKNQKKRRRRRNIDKILNSYSRVNIAPVAMRAVVALNSRKERCYSIPFPPFGSIFLCVSFLVHMLLLLHFSFDFHQPNLSISIFIRHFVLSRSFCRIRVPLFVFFFFFSCSLIVRNWSTGDACLCGPIMHIKVHLLYYANALVSFPHVLSRHFLLRVLQSIRDTKICSEHMHSFIFVVSIIFHSRRFFLVYCAHSSDSRIR